MNSLFDKLIFFDDAHKTVSIYLLIFILITFFQNLLFNFEYSSLMFYTASIIPFLICAIGIYRKYTWAEILTAFFALIILFGKIYYFSRTDINTIKYSDFIFEPFLLLLAVAIYALVFRIRFLRSKSLTESFERYS